jgi:DNA-binding LytR/AlgR family response regulator
MEKLTILIVEDDPIIGADLQDRLPEMGYGALGPFPSGEEALTFFGTPTPPDLVIMDIQLEGQLDGIETARRIFEKHPSLPIIFLTSNSDDATFTKAKMTKPAAFLSKPFRGRDLKHAIELAIAQSASRKEPTGEDTTEENAFLLKDRLFIKAKDRMVRLFFKDILWVEADDYYCKVVTKEKEFLVTQTLKKFGEELAGVPELMRVHRSYIVNLAHVEEIGELYLHIGKRQIPFSKTFKEELMGRLRSA